MITWYWKEPTVGVISVESLSATHETKFTLHVNWYLNLKKKGKKKKPEGANISYFHNILCWILFAFALEHYFELICGQSKLQLFFMEISLSLPQWDFKVFEKVSFFHTKNKYRSLHCLNCFLKNLAAFPHYSMLIK